MKAHKTADVDENYIIALVGDIPGASVPTDDDSAAERQQKMDVLKESTRLERYATSTGGDTFYAGKDRGLENLYASVTEQARNQYTITFQPQDTDRSKDFHSIEVRVRRPDLDVTARQGYYQSGLH